MPELFLSIYFAYKNSLIAKAKGLNTVLWVFITILAFLFAEIIGVGLVMAFFYRGGNNPEAVKEFLFSHPLQVVFIYFTAIGGCLFVRYVLENKRGVGEISEDESDNTDY
jgi:hypothetical protein